MGWTGYAVLALFFWGGWGFLTKTAVRHLPAQGVFLVGILGYLPVLALLFQGTGWRIPWHPAGWATAAAAGLCTSLGLLCYVRALAAGGQASVVVPITGLYPVVTLILSWLFLQESLSLRQGAGVLLALAAVWLLAE